jgi:glycosyltransferase involved in cell wall biosynthesis
MSHGDQRTQLAAYTDAFEWGGADMALAGLIGALDERFAVTVVGIAPEIVEKVAASRPGAPTRLLPAVKNKWDARGSFAHLRAIRELRPDLLHANLRHPWSCQYALAAGNLTPGVKTIAVQQCTAPPEKRSQVLLNRLNFARLDAHIAVSRGTAEKIEGWASLRPHSLRVIYNGIDAPSPPPEPVPRIANGPVIGSVGRLHPQKGYEFLLRALPSIPGASVVLVGDGEGRIGLERLAGELGIAERVTFAGWQPDPFPWLPSFDVFAMPSLFEGFPRAGVEAMLAQLPVVASRVDGIPEGVADGETGILVPPEDPDALAGALNTLIADPDRRRRMGELGRRRAIENFSLGKSVREFESLYAELLSL